MIYGLPTPSPETYQGKELAAEYTYQEGIYRLQHLDYVEIYQISKCQECASKVNAFCMDIKLLKRKLPPQPRLSANAKI